MSKKGLPFQIDEIDRLRLLDDSPGFLYSLVIANQRDWETISKNISQNLFINNMVPIYIRSEMNTQGSEQFRIIHGKAFDLVNEDAYLVWKSEMEEEMEKLLQTESNLSNDLKNIDQIIMEIEVINTKDTVLILNKKLKDAEGELAEFLNQIRIKNEKTLTINKKIDNTEVTLIEESNKLEEINTSLKQIEEYIEKSQKIQFEKNLIINAKKQIEDLRGNIHNLDDDNYNIQYEKDKIIESYGDWKIEIRGLIKELQEVYKEAIYEYRKDDTYSNHKIPDFPVSADRLSLLISKRKVIEENIIAQNSRIAILDNDLKYLNKELSRFNKELERLSKDWTSFDYLGLSLDEINIRIDKSSRHIENLELERNQIKSLLDNIIGGLGIMKEQILDKESEIFTKHKKAPVVLDIENIKSELDIVERDTKSNQDYPNVCQEILEKNHARKIKLEVNLSKIKTGYALDLTKGKMNKLLKDKIQETPDIIVEEWLNKCENNMSQINRTTDEGQQLISRFIKETDNKLEENRLKEKIISTVKEAHISNFKSNLISFKSMESHFQNELLRLSKDKSKA